MADGSPDSGNFICADSHADSGSAYQNAPVIRSGSHGICNFESNIGIQDYFAFGGAKIIKIDAFFLQVFHDCFF